MAATSRLSNCSGVSRRDLFRLGAGGLRLWLVRRPRPRAVRPGAGEPGYRNRSVRQDPGRLRVVRRQRRPEYRRPLRQSDVLQASADDRHQGTRPAQDRRAVRLAQVDARDEALYDEGKVAIVQGVGYDQPSFSHFTSVSFWHTAAPNSGNEYGWIGRTASALDPSGARENMIVNISDSQTLAVKGEKHVPLVFVDPARFQRGVFAQEKAALDTLGAPHAPVGDAHRYVMEVTRSAAQASEVVRAAWNKYQGQDNADLRLLDLDKVAALIEADFPTRLYYVPLRGSLFDTHVNQASPHDRQLGPARMRWRASSRKCSASAAPTTW